jgi:uncharacterized protein YukJ
MPLGKGYAVLKGHAVGGVLAEQGEDHYSVHVKDGQREYRIAINIRSSAPGFGKDLFFYLNEDFQHPILDALKALPPGRKPFKANASAQERRDAGICLDFIRGNLFDRSEMKIFKAQADGPNNDLNERIDALIHRAVEDPQSEIYAFGEPWGPETKEDKVFEFTPGNGIHDIHMNQGDLTGDHAHEDGVYQDGGLILFDAGTGRFTAYFTKFQSQSWHTSDSTGHAIGATGEPLPPGVPPIPGPGGGNPTGPGHDPDHQVRIVAALVNPVGPDPEPETVTLLNTLADAVDLSGWALLDKQKQRMSLTGAIPAGGTLQVSVQPPVHLSNNGGIITLLNQHGVKVDGVSYTGSQAHHEGVTITF